jgi:Relaxase/Mobilisation nuclease domain
MVQRINISRSLRAVFNYNEKKLASRSAELIHAANFLKLPSQMDPEERWQRFEKVQARNERAKKRAVQISLNFHPSEKERLNKELLREIASEYMKRIGFENQPYLIYQHHDSAHPHVHIVSTLIRNDGTSMYTINFYESAKVRKELEQIYELVRPIKRGQEQKAEQKLEQTQKIAQAQKLQYGRAATKQSISKVLEMVIDQYKYTSLVELNAVLRQYNIVADRGRLGNRMHQNNGLIYQILDEKGRGQSVPIHAGSLESKPTLKNLEKKFLENEQKRQPELKRLRNAIDWTLVKPQKSLKEFVKVLEKERVSAVVLRDKEGRARGFAYIDHQTRSVFDDAGLEQKYQAASILVRVEISKSREMTKEMTLDLFKEQIPERSKKDEYENHLSQALEMILKPEEETHEEQRRNLKLELEQENKRKQELERSPEL